MTHPTLSDVHRVDLATRARVVLELCKRTHDVDERHELVAAAFLPAKCPESGQTAAGTAAVYAEDAGGQLQLDLGATG